LQKGKISSVTQLRAKGSFCDHISAF